MWIAWLITYIMAQTLGIIFLDKKKDGLDMVEDIWLVLFLFCIFPGVIGFVIWQSMQDDEL